MTTEQRKDLAAAYTNMLQSSAWKHFEGILKTIEEVAVRDEDAVSIEKLPTAIGMIAECRGRRAAVKKIRSELDYILNGLQ